MKEETTMNKTYIQPSLMVMHLKNERLLNNASMPMKNGQATEWGAKGGSILWSDDDFAYEDYEEE